MLSIITAIFPCAFAGDFGFYLYTTQWTLATSAVTFQCALASKSIKEKSMSLKNGSSGTPQSEESRVRSQACRAAVYKLFGVAFNDESLMAELGWVTCLESSPTVLALVEALQNIQHAYGTPDDDDYVTTSASKALAAYEAEINSRQTLS